MEIALDINGFPVLSPFFTRRSICFNEGWGFEDNEDFDKALRDLKILKHKKELLKDIYEFTFNEFPLKMELPKEYLEEDVLNASFKTEWNSPEWRKRQEMTEKFKARPFNISLPHDFARQVVKKYYDLENKNN